MSWKDLLKIKIAWQIEDDGHTQIAADILDTTFRYESVPNKSEQIGLGQRLQKYVESKEPELIEVKEC